MSLHDYRASRDLAISASFHALLMAAMRKADTHNAALLQSAFPRVWDELTSRYRRPGGILPTDNEVTA